MLRAIEQADFVYFGIDHAEPALDPGALAGLRDYRSRPLTIVDFNSRWLGQLGSDRRLRRHLLSRVQRRSL